MDPITWATLLPVIIRDGIPAAMRLWTLLQSNAEPTQADWDALQKLSEKTYDQYIADAQKRAALPAPDFEPTPLPVPPAPQSP